MSNWKKTKIMKKIKMNVRNMRKIPTAKKGT